MKLLVAIAFIFCSCSVTKYDRQQQATLIAIDAIAVNKAILKLRLTDQYDTLIMAGGIKGLLTRPTEYVTYYEKRRGLGKGNWMYGDKYTVYFLKDQVVKISRNK